MVKSMDKNIAELNALSIDKRIAYFFNEVNKNQALWILRDEHGCMMLNTDDEDCIPVWPNEELTTAWINGEWQACYAHQITLSTWLNEWTRGLTEDGLSIVVFPNHEEEGMVFYPDELAYELKHHC